MLKGEVFVGGAVQVKDVDGRIVHCDFEKPNIKILFVIVPQLGCKVFADWPKCRQGPSPACFSRSSCVRLTPCVV